MMTLPLNIWSRSRFHVSLKKCLVLSLKCGKAKAVNPNWGWFIWHWVYWVCIGYIPHYPWPFQDPIYWRYLPYIRPRFQGISHQNMAKNMVQYLHENGSWNSHWIVPFYHPHHSLTHWWDGSDGLPRLSRWSISRWGSHPKKCWFKEVLQFGS